MSQANITKYVKWKKSENCILIGFVWGNIWGTLKMLSYHHPEANSPKKIHHFLEILETESWSPENVDDCGSKRGRDGRCAITIIVWYPYWE